MTTKHKQPGTGELFHRGQLKKRKKFRRSGRRNLNRAAPTDGRQAIDLMNKLHGGDL